MWTLYRYVPIKIFLDVLNNENLAPYETFVIDTGGKMLDFMGEYIIKNNPKMGRANGMLTLQGFGERKMMFSALVKRISIMNKHVVFVAHRETKNRGRRYSLHSSIWRDKL